MRPQKFVAQVGVDHGYGPGVSKHGLVDHLVCPEEIVLGVLLNRQGTDIADPSAAASVKKTVQDVYSADSADWPTPIVWLPVTDFTNVGQGGDLSKRVDSAAAFRLAITGLPGFALVTGAACAADVAGSREGTVILDNAAAPVDGTTMLANFAVPFAVGDTFSINYCPFVFNVGAGNSQVTSSGPPFVVTSSLDLTVATLDDLLGYMYFIVGSPTPPAVAAGKITIDTGTTQSTVLAGSSLAKIGFIAGTIPMTTSLITQFPGLNGDTLHLDILGYGAPTGRDGDGYGRLAIRFGTPDIVNFRSAESLSRLGSVLNNLGTVYNRAGSTLSLGADIIAGAIAIGGAVLGGTYEGTIRVPSENSAATTLGFVIKTYPPVVTLAGEFVGTPATNNNTIPAPITGGTLLSGAGGASSDSITVPFTVANSLTAFPAAGAPVVIFFTASGGTDDATHVPIDSSIAQLLAKIDAATGATTPSAVTAGAVHFHGTPAGDVAVNWGGTASSAASMGLPGVTVSRAITGDAATAELYVLQAGT